MDNQNTPEYLEKVKAQVFENLRHTGHAPSVQMTEIPKMEHDTMEVDEDLDEPNVRKPRKSLRSSRLPRRFIRDCLIAFQSACSMH